MIAAVEIKPLAVFRLWLKFSDGVEGVADLSDFAGRGVFALWDDYPAFENVRIGSSGQIAWNDDVEMSAESLYLRITGKQPEDIFPLLKELTEYAGD